MTCGIVSGLDGRIKAGVKANAAVVVIAIAILNSYHGYTIPP